MLDHLCKTFFQGILPLRARVLTRKIVCMQFYKMIRFVITNFLLCWELEARSDYCNSATECHIFNRIMYEKVWRKTMLGSRCCNRYNAMTIFRPESWISSSNHTLLPTLKSSLGDIPYCVFRNFKGDNNCSLQWKLVINGLRYKAVLTIK